MRRTLQQETINPRVEELFNENSLIPIAVLINNTYINHESKTKLQLFLDN